MDRRNSIPRTKSRSRAKPSQKVLTPGSPSHLRPRKPPRLAIWRMISRSVGGYGGRYLLRQEIGALPFRFAEQLTGGQVWMGAPQPDEVRQAPRHHQIDRQSQLDLVDRAELQGFHPTAILEDMESRFPSARDTSRSARRRLRSRWPPDWSASAIQRAERLEGPRFPWQSRRSRRADRLDRWATRRGRQRASGAPDERLACPAPAG